MEKTLADLPVGSMAKIAGFRKSYRQYRQKLISMGLTPGIQFMVTRVAPLGDPVEIEIRDYSLSLRKGEAEAIMVED